jgi:hypothetical protein
MAPVHPHRNRWESRQPRSHEVFGSGWVRISSSLASSSALNVWEAIIAPDFLAWD